MQHTDLIQSIDIDLAIRMGIALGIGALIGLERERHREGRTVLAGIRTYPLVALAGVLFAFLGTHLDNSAYIAVGAIVFGAFSALLYWVRHGLGIHGITSPAAFFLTYVTGALIGLGFLIEGILAGIAIAILLFTKQHLHRLAEVMTEEEMSGALQFAVIAFILFPILPSGAIDPWGILQPRQLVLVAIFVSSIGFVSFIIMRLMSTSRGLPVSAMLGGLVNSEATTASLGAIAHEKHKLEDHVVRGISLTNATMVLRNIAIAAVLAPQLHFIGLIAIPISVIFLIQASQALIKRPDPAPAEGSIRLGNPFAIGPGLRFALIFLALQIASYLLRQIPGLGEYAVLLTAAGGLVSSAAVVASAASLVASGTVSIQIAAATAVLATVVSTLNKIILVRGLAPRIVRPVSQRMVVPSGVGLVALAVTQFVV